MIIANLDSSIAFKSFDEIDFPFANFSSSLKVKMPFCFKEKYKWPVKPLWISSPLKLRNTSYVQQGEKEEDDEALSVPIKAIENILINREPQFIR